ncbi:MAG: alpha/beta hydrolase [Polyangiaceae bacterium]
MNLKRDVPEPSVRPKEPLTAATPRWRKLLRFSLFGGLLALFALVAAATLSYRRQSRERAEMMVEATFFDHHGKKIRYVLTGTDKPGPTIVILSGMVASLEQWDDVQPVLSQVAPVLTYDRGGYGLSDEPVAYDADSQAEELADLATMKAVKLPLVVVAFSSSALIARAFTRLHPELLGGLVFLDPNNPEQIIGSTLRETYKRRTLYERRALSTLIQRFLGLRSAAAEVTAAHPTPAQYRASQILSFTSHWEATLGEGRAIAQSAQESLLDWKKVKAPITLLSVSNGSASGETKRRDELYRQFVAVSGARFVNPSGFSHDQIPSDPQLRPYIVEAITSVVNETRAKARPNASPAP